MDYKTGRRNILMHAGMVVDPDEREGDEFGVVGRLRPYVGLRDSDWANLLESLCAVHSTMAHGELRDRKLCVAMWEIVSRVNRYAIWDEGVLRRNELITDQQVKWISSWNRAIERFGKGMIEGESLARCLSPAVAHIASFGVTDRVAFQFLVKHLSRVRKVLLGVAFSVKDWERLRKMI